MAVPVIMNPPAVESNAAPILDAASVEIPAVAAMDPVAWSILSARSSAACGCDSETDDGALADRCE